jgi:hypothetical protein
MALIVGCGIRMLMPARARVVIAIFVSAHISSLNSE